MKTTALLLLLATPLCAQSPKKKTSSCHISPSVRPAVAGYALKARESALLAKNNYTRNILLKQIAGMEVCLGNLTEAARLSDLAYPSNSSALDELGQAVVATGKLEQVPLLEKSMTHGTHSFLYGIVEGLAQKGRWQQADSYAAKITSPEVQRGARQEIIEALYQAGKKEEAVARVNTYYAALSAEDKKRANPDSTLLEMAVRAGDWPEAHRRIEALPDGLEKNYMAAMLASEEAERNVPTAKEDLLAAAKAYAADHRIPYQGYLISSRLAGLGDLDAAEAAADTLRDDEWNQKARTTIALFAADAGQLDRVRANIAKIGEGPLEHKLDNAPFSRDMAREHVAAALVISGHSKEALSLLAEHEDPDDIGNGLLSAHISALASSGDITQARALLESHLKENVVLDEETLNMANGFAVPWHVASPRTAEAWIAQQKDALLRASLWLTLASVASGEKPVANHYFANFD